jgi:uncharacterized protein YjlB
MRTKPAADVARSIGEKSTPFEIVDNVLTSVSYHKDDGKVPNSHLPVIMYHRALLIPNPMERKNLTKWYVALKERVMPNGWNVDWIQENAILRERHYHTWSHEVLIALRGESKLRIGGEKGVNLNFAAGDVLAIPAGVAHERRGIGTDFVVAGLYPIGCRWNTCYVHPDTYKRAKKELPRVKMPRHDPLYGINGPMVKQWIVISESVTA